MTQSTNQQDASPFRAHRSAIEDLPPSAKLVARIIARRPELTQAQIAEESLLPERTVRYALNRLDDAGVVETSHDASDARRELYSLRSPP